MPPTKQTTAAVAKAPTLPDPALFQRIRASYRARYDYQPETPEQLYAIRPTFVLDWSSFMKDVTRWRFDH
ncbi:MAG TPA: hypothetical protein VFN74_22515 [Chloroflexota bacterium]|jgi:hypothetical protein|nr:hypothetical protein [Chloroflexota bacterium]